MMMSYDSFAASFLQLALNFIVYLFFILYAFQDKLRYPKAVHRLLVFAYSVGSTIVIMLFHLAISPYKEYRYLALILWLVATIAIAFFLLRSNLLQLIFFIFIILALQLNVMEISETLYYLDFLSALFPSGDWQLLSINCLVLLLFIPPMWYLCCYLFRKVISLEISKSYWNALFVIPIYAYLYCIFRTTNQLLKTDGDLIMELFALLLLNLFSFLAYITVLNLLLKTHDSLVSQKNAAVIEKQILIQNAQYKKLSANMEQNARLHHDLRHHFVTLRGHLANEDYAGAVAYLDTCMDKSLPRSELCLCENHSVDMLLRYYLAPAKENGIDIRTSVQLPDSCKIPDTDLCIVFGNLVENALEGCAKQKDGDKKFIAIQTKSIKDEMLALTVTNSFSGYICPRKTGFLSTKHEGLGVGTQSVINIAESHGGSCQFSFEKNVFKASVLLVS